MVGLPKSALNLYIGNAEKKRIHASVVIQCITHAVWLLFTYAVVRRCITVLLFTHATIGICNTNKG